MPLYHFHVHTDVDEPDREGTVLMGVSEARSQALLLIGRIVCDAGLCRDRETGWSVTVTDRDDLILFRIDCVVTAWRSW